MSLTVLNLHMMKVETTSSSWVFYQLFVLHVKFGVLGHCTCDSSLVIVNEVYVEGGLCTLGVGFA